MLKETLSPLSERSLRREVTAMQGAIGLRLVNTRGSAPLRPCATACARGAAALPHMPQSCARWSTPASRSSMPSTASPSSSGPCPTSRASAELDLIERRYGEHLGLTRAWRLAAPGASEQFRRMLLSKLRVVFETASAASSRCGASPPSRRSSRSCASAATCFKRRREALERIQSAAGELEQRWRTRSVRNSTCANSQQRPAGQRWSGPRSTPPTHDMPELTARRDAA
jgi:hypothetical protein